MSDVTIQAFAAGWHPNNYTFDLGRYSWQYIKLPEP